MDKQTWVRVLLGAIACASVGCGSSSSASKSDAVALPDGDPAFDAPCPADGTLTPRNILASVKSVYTGIYHPERGSTQATPLTIDVAYANGKIVCTPASAGSGRDPAPAVASLSVELALTFKTDDGTFDESFVAPVISRTGDPSTTATSAVSWSVTIPGTAVRGSYAFTQGTADQVHLSLDGGFNYPTPGKTYGEVSEQSAKVSSGGGSW